MQFSWSKTSYAIFLVQNMLCNFLGPKQTSAARQGQQPQAAQQASAWALERYSNLSTKFYLSTPFAMVVHTMSMSTLSMSISMSISSIVGISLGSRSLSKSQHKISPQRSSCHGGEHQVHVHSVHGGGYGVLNPIWSIFIRFLALKNGIETHRQQFFKNTYYQCVHGHDCHVHQEDHEQQQQVLKLSGNEHVIQL